MVGGEEHLIEKGNMRYIPIKEKFWINGKNLHLMSLYRRSS